MRRIDNCIFDTCPAIQKLADTVSWYTTAEPTTQARLVLIIGSAAYCSLLWLQIHQGDASIWPRIFIQGLLVMLYLVWTMVQDVSTGTSTQRNPLRIKETEILTRMVMVTVLLMWVFTVLFRADIFAWEILGHGSVTLALYLTACDKLPPGEHFWSQSKNKVTL